MKNPQSEANQSIRQTATKGVVWTAAQKYGDRFFSFVVLLVLARLLSPEAFGIVALAAVFITVAQMFIDLGFGDAIVQAAKIDQTLLNTAFWTNFIASCLVLSISVLFSQKIAAFYHEPRLTLIIRWLSLCFIFSALSRVQEALLRRQLDFKSLAIRTFIATFASGLIAVGMAVLGAGVWSLVAKIVLFMCISAVVLWGISDWRPSFSFSKTSFKKLYKYGINIFGANLIDFFSRRFGDLLIGYFLGATLLGYYSLAYALLITSTELIIVVPTTVTFPAFSRIQHDASLMQKSTYEVTQMISIITIPFFVSMSILAPEVVLALYGSKWTNSIGVVRVLMLIGIVHSAMYFFGSLMKAIGKPQWRFAVLSVMAVLNIIAFSIAVRWGIVAVAVSFVCVGYFMFPIYLYLVSKAINLNIKTYFKQYIPAILSTLFMSAMILFAKNALQSALGVHLRLAVLVVLGLLCYFLSLFLVARPVFYRFLKLALDVIPQKTPFLARIQKNLKGIRQYN